MTNRRVSFGEFNHPHYEARQPLTMVLEQHAEGVRAVLSESPTVVADGGNAADAMMNLRDALYGAIDAKLPQVMGLFRERTEEPIAPVAAINAVPQAPKGSIVYVLLESDGSVAGVTQQRDWAERWEKWRQGAAAKEFTLEVLP